MRLKKQIARQLIKEIMVDITGEGKRLDFIIHWHGGTHTELSIKRPMPASMTHKTNKDDIEIITKMAELRSDSDIAMVLGKLGRKTGKGNRWTSTRVSVARRKYCQGVEKSKRCEDLITVAQAQQYCGVSNQTIIRLIETNLLQAAQVVPYAPYATTKSDFDCEPLLSIIKHLKKTGRLVLERDVVEKQENLFL